MLSFLLQIKCCESDNDASLLNLYPFLRRLIKQIYIIMQTYYDTGNVDYLSCFTGSLYIVMTFHIIPQKQAFGKMLNNRGAWHELIWVTRYLPGIIIFHILTFVLQSQLHQNHKDSSSSSSLPCSWFIFFSAI